jgi:hypothetical protein
MLDSSLYTPQMSIYWMVPKRLPGAWTVSLAVLVWVTPAADPLTVSVDVARGVIESPEAVVETVRVVEAPAAVGVTLLLENCPVAPVGRPLTPGVTEPENPLDVVKVTV